MPNLLKGRRGISSEKAATGHHDDSPVAAPSPATDEKGVLEDTEFAGADISGVDPKKVLLKMDLHLIPMLALLYLLSFLDRGNIGNARETPSESPSPAQVQLTEPSLQASKACWKRWK